MIDNSIPFDQWQRYKNAQLIIDNVRCDNECLKVLEVGANKHLNLEKFLPNDKIMYLDIEIPDEFRNSENYIQGDATKMQFEDNKFDVCIALDVFEHINSNSREAFISEMNRVSKLAFIISAPFNDEEVVVAESNCNNIFRMLHGIEYRWLAEHKEEKLPSFKDTKKFLEKLDIDYEFFGHGNVNLWERIMNAHFVSSFNEELLEYRKKIDLYYNENLFKKDYSNNSYRKFIVGGKVNKELISFSINTDSLVYDEQLEKLEIQLYSKAYEKLKDVITALSEKDEEIYNSRKVIEEKDKEIDNSRKVIEEKDKEIDNSRRVIEEKENEIKKASGVIEGKDEEIKNARSVIEEMRKNK